MADAAVKESCLMLMDGGLEPGSYYVPHEVPLQIWVNGEQWVTVMCSPVAQKELALGHAFFAGIISGLDDVLLLEHCAEDPRVLRLQVRGQPQIDRVPRLLTSGCGQEPSWPESIRLRRVPAVEPGFIARLPELMQELWKGARSTRDAAGLHVSALWAQGEFVSTQIDIGRHNTVDKLMGHCLLAGLDPAGMVLLTSGRVSSEMAYKAFQMGVSVVASRTTPTDMAVALARRAGICLVGYVRGSQAIVYSGPWPEAEEPGTRDATFAMVEEDTDG
jgi:FdhD protein